MPDVRITVKKLVDKYDLNEKIKTLVLKEKMKKIATKTKLKAEQDKML